MKYLLVLAALLFGIWLWRSGRGNKAPPEKPTRNKPPALQDMVSCAVCSVHLPQNDAVKGRLAWYCSDGHRTRGEP